MSLTTPSSVQKLQTALHAKAKEALQFRFHALYDKVYRKDVLTYAYERCEANGGAAGADEQTFEDIEKYGRERWLDELTQELKSGTYPDKTIQRILRHSNVAVTQGRYIKTADSEATAAMRQFGQSLEYAPNMHLSGVERPRLM
jgi:integrase